MGCTPRPPASEFHHWAKLYFQNILYPPLLTNSTNIMIVQKLSKPDIDITDKRRLYIKIHDHECTMSNSHVKEASFLNLSLGPKSLLGSSGYLKGIFENKINCDRVMLIPMHLVM